MSYAMNVSAVDHCRICDDTGYVELAGIDKQHGIEYSRGTAPCKWCEMGKRRYARLTELKQHPTTDFGLTDVLGYNRDDRPGTPSEIAAITKQRPTLKRLPVVGESERTIEARKHAAANAAKAASRADAHSPQAPPRRSEPAGTPTPYEPEDVPF